MEKLSYKIDVPAKFCFPDTLLYPEGNWPDQEYYFFQTYKGDQEIERIYLPIMWTAYFKFHNYGKNNRAIKELQDYVNKLDKSLKYFTLCQFDDSTMMDWTGIDILIFGSGCKGDYQISLTCQPHKFDFSDVKKDILCSFVGRITHPIREEIMKLKNEKDFYITEVHHDQYDYHKIMARSEFIITPRGYGQSCFKIAEALQNNAIPIYVSDEFLLPHAHFAHFVHYGLKVQKSQIQDIPEKIKTEKTKPLFDYRKKIIPQVYKEFYTFEGNKKYILKVLRNEMDRFS